MTKNLGSLDRILWIAATLGPAVIAWNHTLQGAFAIGGWLVAAIFILTSILGFCPAYHLTGANTCRKL